MHLENIEVRAGVGVIADIVGEFPGAYFSTAAEDGDVASTEAKVTVSGYRPASDEEIDLTPHITPIEGSPGQYALSASVRVTFVNRDRAGRQATAYTAAGPRVLREYIPAPHPNDKPLPPPPPPLVDIGHPEGRPKGGRKAR